jgi:dephospho-CoA kinase
MSKIDSRDA